jgi:hypothetical protein
MTLEVSSSSDGFETGQIVVDGNSEVWACIHGAMNSGTINWKIL